ncbi:unnamed protein product, partial [Dibothriocephalus latus]
MSTSKAYSSRHRLFASVGNEADLVLPPIPQDTIKSAQQLSGGKATEFDAMPAEIYKYGSHQLLFHVTTLFQEMWRQGQVPQDFKDATSTVHLYELKGNRQLRDNHRGISLPSVAGKNLRRGAKLQLSLQT